MRLGPWFKVSQLVSPRESGPPDASLGRTPVCGSLALPEGAQDTESLV